MMVAMTARPTFLAVALLAATLTACGGAASSASDAPEASTVVTPAPASQAPSPSVALASEAPPTQEPPPADAGGPYAEALVGALAADPLVMHLEQVATATTTLGDVEATLSGDFSGNDLDITMHIAAGANEVDMKMVVLGETAYVQQGDADWVSVPKEAAEAELAGLVQNMRLVTDPLDLRYVGAEAINGRDLHHLTASRTIPYAPAAGGTGQYDVFDIWVEEDGTPVLAKTAFSATDPNGVAVTGTTNFEFSNVGGPIEIVAPE
jgi:LppX_LprAFG lipoprotein